MSEQNRRLDLASEALKALTEYVQEQSIANKQRLEARDAETRKRNLDELRAMAADPARARRFLLGTSMISSQRRVAAMTLAEA